MSLLGFDGFTRYSNLADVAEVWTREGSAANSALNTTGGQHEAGALQIGGIDRSDDEWYWDLTALKTELTFGFWFKFIDFDTTDDTDDMFIQIQSSTTTRCSFRLSSDGSIQFRRLTTSTEIFDSADATETFSGNPEFLFRDIEYKIEIKLSMINTTGSMELRVNDQVWARFQGNVDLDGTVNRIYFCTGVTGSGAQYEISDFYVLEDDGTDPITFLGSKWQVEVLRPTAESATESDWTPESGTDNSAMVDDAPRHDADATYINSAVNGNIDRYTTSNTLSQQRVMGVNVISLARHEGAADNYRNVIFEGATAGNGSTEALTAEFVPYHALFTTNPDTSAEWTKAEVEGCEFGVEDMA